MKDFARQLLEAGSPALGGRCWRTDLEPGARCGSPGPRGLGARTARRRDRAAGARHLDLARACLMRRGLRHDQPRTGSPARQMRDIHANHPANCRVYSARRACAIIMCAMPAEARRPCAHAALALPESIWDRPSGIANSKAECAGSPGRRSPDRPATGAGHAGSLRGEYCHESPGAKFVGPRRDACLRPSARHCVPSKVNDLRAVRAPWTGARRRPDPRGRPTERQMILTCSGKSGTTRVRRHARDDGITFATTAVLIRVSLDDDDLVLRRDRLLRQVRPYSSCDASCRSASRGVQVLGRFTPVAVVQAARTKRLDRRARDVADRLYRRPRKRSYTPPTALRFWARNLWISLVREALGAQMASGNPHETGA